MANSLGIIVPKLTGTRQLLLKVSL